MTGTALINVNAALGAGYSNLPKAEEMEWQLSGACREMDSWIFFPEGRTNEGDVRWAKRICRDCPVRAECQEWALSRHEEYGVWGGLSDKERKAIWKKQKESFFTR
jgi:WhiB family transcriptional regulator, redox-sensing transcriptional regulator